MMLVLSQTSTSHQSFRKDVVATGDDDSFPLFLEEALLLEDAFLLDSQVQTVRRARVMSLKAALQKSGGS